MTEDNKELINVLKNIDEKLGDMRYDLKDIKKMTCPPKSSPVVMLDWNWK